MDGEPSSCAHPDRVRRQQRVRGAGLPAGRPARASTTGVLCLYTVRVESRVARRCGSRCARCSGACDGRRGARGATCAGELEVRDRPAGRAAGRARRRGARACARRCATASGRARCACSPRRPTTADVTHARARLGPALRSRRHGSSRRCCWRTWPRSRRPSSSSRGDLTQRARRAQFARRAPLPRPAAGARTSWCRATTTSRCTTSCAASLEPARPLPAHDRRRPRPTFLDDELAVLGLNTARPQRVEGGTHLADADRGHPLARLGRRRAACACS